MRNGTVINIAHREPDTGGPSMIRPSRNWINSSYSLTFSYGSNLQTRLLEEGIVKGQGDGERPLSSAMSSLPEETLEDIKGKSNIGRQ